MTSNSGPTCAKNPNIVLNPTPLRYAPPGTEPLVRTAPTTPAVPTETPMKKTKKRPQKTPKSNTETPPVNPPANEDAPPVKKNKKSKGEDSPAVAVQTNGSTPSVKKSRKAKGGEETPAGATPANGEATPVTAKKSRKPSKGEELPAGALPSWLPEGWIIKEHVREFGKSAGTKDKYYIEPVTGKRFRSQREVQRHLGISVETPKQNPSKNEGSKAGEFSAEGKKWKIEEETPNGEKIKEKKLDDIKDKKSDGNKEEKSEENKEEISGENKEEKSEENEEISEENKDEKSEEKESDEEELKNK